MNVQEETEKVNEARKKIKEEMKDRDEMTESARIYDVRTSGGRLSFLKKVKEIMNIFVEKLLVLTLFSRFLLQKQSFTNQKRCIVHFQLFGNCYGAI